MGKGGRQSRLSQAGSSLGLPPLLGLEPMEKRGWPGSEAIGAHGVGWRWLCRPSALRLSRLRLASQRLLPPGCLKLDHTVQASQIWLIPLPWAAQPSGSRRVKDRGQPPCSVDRPKLRGPSFLSSYCHCWLLLGTHTIHWFQRNLPAT